MTSEEIEALFTRSDGSYLCARWGRPIVPVVFGVEEATLRIVKGAIEAVVALAGHRMAETDPELGANFMMFFLRDWRELLEVRDLDRLIPELAELVPRLEAAEANQYRVFRFDEAGGIKACFAFVRMDAELGGGAGRGAGAEPGGAGDPPVVGPGVHRPFGACADRGRGDDPAAGGGGGDPRGLRSGVAGDGAGPGPCVAAVGQAGPPRLTLRSRRQLRRCGSTVPWGTVCMASLTVG